MIPSRCGAPCAACAPPRDPGTPRFSEVQAALELGSHLPPLSPAPFREEGKGTPAWRLPPASLSTWPRRLLSRSSSQQLVPSELRPQVLQRSSWGSSGAHGNGGTGSPGWVALTPCFPQLSPEAASRSPGGRVASG